MATDLEQHVALPKLYGAPAYARPPRPVADTSRPPDLDDLPLEADQTDEERVLADVVRQRAGGAGWTLRGDGRVAAARAERGLEPRPFRLAGLGRILGAR